MEMTTRRYIFCAGHTRPWAMVIADVKKSIFTVTFAAEYLNHTIRIFTAYYTN